MIRKNRLPSQVIARLLDLLDATTDALAATWETVSDEEASHAGDDFGPTIQ
jgi:hypothetical protein